ncbi:alpha/beta fold hydrolase [Gordonia rhizosphera]|uniref:Pimeloyl-CoA synthesis protein n=1 Tax=Gordonia rhizosphera NBRC 16068 TaxID=1108045 RepID=K6WGG2_9ACTN|nr:alpha/beta hydrolase [Gordonia rhizosphera]GAB91257.1 pimeloyl-CoA synthesis protein [Gordonia rhizosphera NBRC 16068]
MTAVMSAISAATHVAVQLNSTLYAPVMGTRMGYHRVMGSGPGLVLLNGFGASGAVWPTALGELASRYTVIAVDARGTGGSRHLTPAFTIEDLADDVWAAMLGADIKRATVVGWSMGGMVAQELAIRHPDAVGRLILINTVAPIPAMQIPFFRTSWTLWRIALRESTDGWRRAVWSLGGPGAQHESPRELRELTAQLRTSGIAWWTPLLQSAASTSWRRPERLRDIIAPTTILHGRDDPIVPVRNARILADLIPGAEVQILDHAGHLLPYEATGQLLDAINRIQEAP